MFINLQILHTLAQVHINTHIYNHTITYVCNISYIYLVTYSYHCSFPHFNLNAVIMEEKFQNYGSVLRMAGELPGATHSISPAINSLYGTFVTINDPVTMYYY